MGRGSAYRHEFFMLIDEDELNHDVLDDQDEMEDRWRLFCGDVAQKFGLCRNNAFQRREFTERLQRESSFIGGNDKMLVGIDGRGGLPALVVFPRTYETPSSHEEKEYKLRLPVKQVFNRLIKAWPKVFRYPTSAWTSHLYDRY